MVCDSLLVILSLHRVLEERRGRYIISYNIISIVNLKQIHTVTYIVPYRTKIKLPDRNQRICIYITVDYSFPAELDILIDW